MSVEVGASGPVDDGDEFTPGTLATLRLVYDWFLALRVVGIAFLVLLSELLASFWLLLIILPGDNSPYDYYQPPFSIPTYSWQPGEPYYAAPDIAQRLEAAGIGCTHLISTQDGVVSCDPFGVTAPSDWYFHNSSRCLDIKVPPTTMDQVTDVNKLSVELHHVLTANDDDAGINVVLGGYWVIEACPAADVDRIAAVMGGVVYHDPMWRPRVAIPPNLPGKPTYRIQDDVPGKLTAAGLGCSDVSGDYYDGWQCTLFAGTPQATCVQLRVAYQLLTRDDLVAWAIYDGRTVLVVGGNWVASLCQPDPVVAQRVQGVLGGVVVSVGK